MSRAVFNTTLMWHDSKGGEVEAYVRVLYSFTKGYADTWEEPGSPDEIEIISITPADSLIDIPEHFYTSEELLAECEEDHAADVENAKEWRAQCRRDDMLMGGRPVTAAPVSQVLSEAADLLEKPGAWTQGESARDRRGRRTATLGEGAVCFCAIGAINRVTGNTYWLKGTAQAFFDDFVEAPERLDLCKAAAWNDTPGRTQAEVVAKLREAAALAKEQGR